MTKFKWQLQGLLLMATVALAAGAWAANRMDTFAVDIGDPNDPFDDSAMIVHPFISKRLQPFPISVFVDRNGNVIDPAVNVNAVPTYLVLHGVSKACRAWNDVSISTFKFQDNAVPTDHTFAKFPGQVLVRGATGFDGYNLVTFQDPLLTQPAGVIGLSITWKIWRKFDLNSFINLPPGVIIPDPPGPVPPGAGQPAMMKIDFDGDGFPDVILEAREYLPGETLEGDEWFNQVTAWHQWPDDPNDLPTSSGGRITRPDTQGTDDIEGTVLHEFGHLMGIAHSNIEASAMYWLVKGPYTQGFLFPTDVWDARTIHLDDEIAAALVYPRSSGSRGTIAGRVLDGRNFDGLPDRSSGVIDAVLYATVYVARQMTSTAIPAFIPDKLLLSTSTLVTQQDLDTSPALWLELLTEIESGDNIVWTQFPNPRSFRSNGVMSGATTATLRFLPPNSAGGAAINIRMGLDASPNYHIPGLHPFDKYIIWMDAFNVYYNDSAGVATDNISLAFDLFFGAPTYQPIPQEFFGGNVDPASRRLIGPDAPIPIQQNPLSTGTIIGDQFTSFVYVSVRPGEITAGIDIFTNTGGLPAGVTPTPLPGVTPTPTAIGIPRFTPESENDHLLPQSTEWSVASAAGDVDNDGDIDLFICNAALAGGSPNPASIINRLYINTLWEPGPNPPATRFPGARSFDNKPIFEDRTFGADGIAATSDDRLPFTQDSTFYAKMADFNNDGYLDIFVCNSGALNSPNAAQNRLFVNRGGRDPSQAGFFDDVTSSPRTDPGIGIPTTFTATIVPGRFNRPPFSAGALVQSLKCDVGDIDSDGDIDIVVGTANLGLGFGVSSAINTCAAPTNTSQYQVILYVTEQILINHTNDFDPRTRGFYFTDETLGLDNQFGEVLTGGFFGGNAATDARTAADRLPPVYPVPSDAEQGLGWQPILGPFMSNGALDLVVIRSTGGTVAPQTGKMFYENSDVDNDGVPDGYYRLVNYGAWEYGTLSLPALIGGTTVTYPFGLTTCTGLGGVGISTTHDHSGCPFPSGWPPEPDVIPITSELGSGGAIADFDYHGFPQLATANYTANMTMYNVQAVLTGNVSMFGAARGQGGLFGGESNAYGFELDWAVPILYRRPPLSPATVTNPFTGQGVGQWLARSAIAQDFDHNGLTDLYVTFQKSLPENNLTGVPVPNKYFTNNGFGVFRDDTAAATSGTARPTYHAVAFDFDMDGDLDIFESNANAQNAIILNQVYTPIDYTRSSIDTLFKSDIDNPAYYDATPKFLPPYYRVVTVPPFALDAGKISVTCAVGDLNNDGLPDIVNANGAVATISGDATDVLLNHGEPPNEGTRVFSPIGSGFPPPAIRAFESFLMMGTSGTVSVAPLFYTRIFRGFALPVYTDDFWLNHFQPAYHALMADFDLDGDFDVLETRLGLGPIIYSNEDSADMMLLGVGGLTERGFNSVPDDDFLGDGILLPGGFQMGLGGSSLPMMPQLSDPGPPHPVTKKQQNRRACLADFDHNGTIDVLIGNGLPANQTTSGPILTGGAPNVLLLNGVDANPIGAFVDKTESNLPTRTVPFTSGSATLFYQEGIPDDTMDVAAADFDNDGVVELVFLNQSDVKSSGTRYLDNDGSGHFFDTRAPGSPDPTRFLPNLRGRRPTRILVADFDGKGDPTEDINGNGVLDPGEDKNANGVLDWYERTPRPGPRIFQGSWDIMITFLDGPPMLFLNNLPGPPGTQFGFTEVSDRDINMRTIASVYGADIGDVDLDGRIDVALAIATQPQLPHVVLLMNQGGGRFSEAGNEVPSNFSAMADPALFFDDFHVICRDVKLFDVDGDGDLDMHLTYSGATGISSMAGALDALFVNRLIPENFNTINRFRNFRSPFVIKLSPSAGYQGMTVRVSLVGRNLDQGLRSANFGPGIAVNGIARTGPDSFEVTLRISSDAPGGAHDVTVTANDGQSAQFRGQFMVLTRASSARASWKQYK